MELLFTVNFRVAHRDRCIDDRCGSVASPASSCGDAMMVGSRAGPDHPEMVARLAKFGRVALPGRYNPKLSAEMGREWRWGPTWTIAHEFVVQEDVS